MWSRQPMYHTYDYGRALYSKPFRVYTHPYKTKYTDVNAVKTHNYDDLSEQLKIRMENLLQGHYISLQNCTFMINKTVLDAYFTGNKHGTVISFQLCSLPSMGKTTIYEYAQQLQAANNDPIGTCLSRSIQIILAGQVKKDAYYVEYICSNRLRSDLHSNRTLIDTHLFSQHYREPNIELSIIRSKGETFPGIVPLVEYDTYNYRMHNLNIQPLPNGYEIVGIQKDNENIITDFFEHIENLENTNPLFDMILNPTIYKYTDLVKSKQCFIYGLRRADTLYAVYVFKHTHIYNEEYDGYVLQCTCSIMNFRSAPIFYNGFLHAIREVLHVNPGFKVLSIDGIAHNEIIHAHWGQSNELLDSHKNALYSYNYVVPGTPFNCKRVLCML